MQPDATADGTVRVAADLESPQVVVVTVDRAPVNAMTPEQYERLATAFEQLEERADIRCVILTGAGSRSFIGGADTRQLAGRTPELMRARARATRRAFAAVRRAPVPVIAALNGAAVGSGLVFAACCDIVLAARGIKMGLPELNVGVPGGTRHLDGLVPERVARYLVFTRQLVGPDFFLPYGAVQEVLEPAALMPRALELARRIAETRGDILRLSKESTRLARDLPFDDGYRVQQLFMAIATAEREAERQDDGT
jgi:enoyl-CoA hydratase